MGKISTKCPFCGSSSITQTNASSNKILGMGIAALGNSITGGHAKGKAIEEELFDRKYQCNSCGKVWKNDGHTLGLEEDEYRARKIAKEVENGEYDFSTHGSVMKFCWKLDAYIHGEVQCEELTGHHNGDSFYCSKEVGAYFHLIKASAILQHVILTYGKSDSTENCMNCSAGMRECSIASGYLQFNENSKCYAILSYIFYNTAFNLDSNKKEELYNNCLTALDEDRLFSCEFWNKMIIWIKEIF